MKREKLIRSKEYIISQIQLGLLNLIGNYKEKKKLKDYQLAKELGVSKGYVSQLLNAIYDHKLSKVVDLSLACNTVPLVFFVPVEEYLQNDRDDKVYQIFPVKRPRQITFQRSIEAPTKISTHENIFADDVAKIQINENQFSLA